MAPDRVTLPKVKKLLPAAVAVVPLLIAPGLTLRYDVVPRLSAFEFLLCAMLLCWTTWLPGLGNLASSAMGRAFLGLNAATAAWIVVCTAASADPALSLYGSTWRS